MRKLGTFPWLTPTTVTNSLQTSDIVGEYGVLPLYRLLGYFSILGLLRVHTMLGDFTLALKSMENVELNQKVFTRPHPARPASDTGNLY